MDIIISNTSQQPIYEQIAFQIKDMIFVGKLNPGDKLPSVRQLAKSLHISVITTQKAYDTLQSEGFVETTVGKGSFVAHRSKAIIEEEQNKKLETYLENCAEIAHINGISFEQLVDLLRMFYEGED